MDTVSTQDIVRNTVLRMVVVLCATVGFGFLFFQLAVFNPRMMAAQFLTDGVTAGITYATVKTPRWRDGLAALLIWFVVRTFLVSEYNWWLIVFYFAYITGIASAVYLYQYFVRNDIVRGMVQRIAASGVITAIANALIVVFLGFWSWHAVIVSPGNFASMIFRNLQYGTLIGIGIGLGVECAEYIVRKWTERTAPAGAPVSAGGTAGVHHESTSVHGETIVVTCASCGEELELSPPEVAAEAYTCPACGKPGTL